VFAGSGGREPRIRRPQEVTVTAAPVFVSYRRTDEPFATAMVASLLAEQLGDDDVFLDTLFLRQRGPFAARLLAALDSCGVVLAVIGTAWDGPKNAARLAESGDWVRRELLHTSDRGVPIVPVLVDRSGLPGFPDLLGRPIDHGRVLQLDTPDIWSSGPALWTAVDDVLPLPRLKPPAARTRPELVERATLAMLRHVLPPPQRSMRNDAMIARAVAATLRDDEWLRFATAASTPGRPNGSAVLFLTRSDLGIIQINPDLEPGKAERTALAQVREVERADRHRLWKPVTDLHFRTTTGTVTVEGLFAEEADELLELAGLPARQGTGR
jgi:TIR domain-containing protein